MDWLQARVRSGNRSPACEDVLFFDELSHHRLTKLSVHSLLASVTAEMKRIDVLPKFAKAEIFFYFNSE